MLVWWLLQSALAGPTVEAFVAGAIDDGEHPGYTAGMVGGAAGWRFGHFEPEVRLQGGLGGTLEPMLLGQVGARGYLTRPDAGRGALSAVIGIGAWLAEGSFGLHESFGLAIDLPAQRWPRLRLEGRYLFAQLQPTALHLSLSLRWGKDPVSVDAVADPEPVETPPEAPVEAAEEPVAEPVAPVAPVAMEELPQPEGPVEAMTAETRVAVLYPVCDVVTAAEAAGLLPEDGARVRSPGYVPAQLAQGDAVALDIAPVQGDLVVVGSPGDELRIDGNEVPLGDDGVAVVHVKAGAHEVVLVGGGRSERWEPYALEGHALWLVAGTSEDAAVLFSVGSSVVRPAARQTLTDWAARLGDWEVEVQGSFSPEGNLQANLALGKARAAAVIDVLVALGIPRERLTLMEAAEPRLDLTAEEQRRVDVRLVRKEGR